MAITVPTYLPTPADAPVVTVVDDQNGDAWLGVIHEGLVNDASGFIAPEDLGYRFRIIRDGVDITETLY